MVFTSASLTLLGGDSSNWCYKEVRDPIQSEEDPSGSATFKTCTWRPRNFSRLPCHLGSTHEGKVTSVGSEFGR
jgi:hypothetical protein